MIQYLKDFIDTDLDISGTIEIVVNETTYIMFKPLSLWTGKHSIDIKNADAFDITPDIRDSVYLVYLPNGDNQYAASVWDGQQVVNFAYWCFVPKLPVLYGDVVLVEKFDDLRFKRLNPVYEEAARKITSNTGMSVLIDDYIYDQVMDALLDRE